MGRTETGLFWGWS